jgi:peptidoglycan hydrolase-like protein with peptidoglycan-binding domain
MVRVATVGESRAEETDADTVRAVQEALNQAGYGPIEADGVMRQPTRAAIMAFEHDQGVGLTGEASQSLLKQLVFGTPDAPSAEAGGEIEVRSPHAEAIIKQVQQSLSTRGYEPGAVDGQISSETVAAICTFETDQGLVPKGRISAEVLERLSTGMSVGGKHPAQGQ